MISISIVNNHEKNIPFLIIVFATSCKTAIHSLAGSYQRVGRDYTYLLILRKDSTFAYSEQYQPYLSICDGKWSSKSEDSLMLECSDEHYLAKATVGYMGQRDHRFRVLSRKKLKMGKFIFKKVDQDIVSAPQVFRKY